MLQDKDSGFGISKKNTQFWGWPGVCFAVWFFLFLNKSIHLSHLLPKIFQNQSCSGFNIPTTPANRNIRPAEQPHDRSRTCVWFYLLRILSPRFPPRDAGSWRASSRSTGGRAASAGRGPAPGAPPRACSRDHSREVGERSRRRSAAQANGGGDTTVGPPAPPTAFPGGP